MIGKFRVWDGKRMCYPEDGFGGEYYLDQEGQICEYSPWNDPGIERIDGIRTFSTDRMVKDKDGNDRELYEGDIVGWNQSIFWNDDDTRRDALFLVQYDHRDCAFMLYMHCNEKPSGGFISVGMACNGWRGSGDQRPVLLGNKYENPELVTTARAGGYSTNHHVLKMGGRNDIITGRPR